MSIKKIWPKLLLFVILLLAFLSVSVFFFKNNTGDSRPISPTERYEKLLSSHPNFGTGATLLAVGKSDEAASFLEKNLEEVSSDTSEEVYTKLLLAFSYATSKKDNEFKKSIPIFIGIINNTRYPRDFRARAAEGVIDLYALKPEVLDILIQHEPYKSLAIETNNDSRLLREKLLVHSESLYPLASVEMKLAALYAEDLAKFPLKNNPDSNKDAEQEQLKRMILTMVDKGLNNLSLTAKYTHLNAYIPDALLAQAIAAQYFEQATSETPFGTPRDLFEKALLESERYYPPQRPTIERYYTIYLDTQS